MPRRSSWSAGAVGSPYLLCSQVLARLTSVGAAGVEVRTTLPGVGQNLRDHPHVYATWQPQPDHLMTRPCRATKVALRYTAPGSTSRKRTCRS